MNTKMANNSNLDIQKLSFELVKDLYPAMYEEIFSLDSSSQAPSFVYVGFRNSDYVGFMSGRIISKEAIEIQWAGFVDTYKGYHAPKLFNTVVDFVHKEYKIIFIRVHNENIPALKVAMHAGFRISGIRSIDGFVFVELISRRE